MLKLSDASDFTGEGLTQALESYLARWGERTGIVVETWALPGTAVPRNLARAVYATVLEALANVERHSGARHVSVAVTLSATGLRMTVSDDGAGFAADRSDRSGGRGLAAMRACLAEVGGTLTINSVLAGGTTVTGAVPV
ncbi:MULTISPECIES: sensor histidine kinase [Streptosporangium]|uniref:Signal transduction histidine kinase n=1 Tax=Streptosporangium brasiliense TaxID=47480 RepID=A0ABT9RAQ0_9ACTN|nr:ATP-binding protein [Streptosporangium brasiliense]MDP9866308.1 signal transduction histidine kinase [Streptosporangium brasiliense]